jgi:HTH-type transcriptional regulator / antitoxin HipB
MFVRTPVDLGAAIKERRKQLGLDQAELAKRIGTSRQWIIGIERGRARAELGLVLRALNALDIRLNAETGKSHKAASISSINIDEIVSSARKSKR